MTSNSSTSAIPFNRPFIIGPEMDYIQQAVESGQLSMDGLFGRKCEEALAASTRVSRSLLTHSCTGALEMAAMLCEIGPGDEVILPSYTFVSTANAFLLRGATLRFVDVREDTLNLDESLIEASVSERTKAIAPVHYAGVGCEMDVIMQLAQERNLRVIEDAAQGISSTYRGQPLGGIGDFGCLSFHETKNLISGEGGALLIKDAAQVNAAEIIREKGTDRAQFFRGEIDKYTWRAVGSSYGPSELVAAFLWAQLEQADKINQKRLQIHALYGALLQPLAERGLLRLPIIPEHCEHNAHMFYILLQDPAQRPALIAHLKEKGIHAVFHYVPLHTSPMGQSLGYAAGDFPVTERVSEQVLRLPCYFGLTEDEQRHIAQEIFNFFAI